MTSPLAVMAAMSSKKAEVVTLSGTTGSPIFTSEFDLSPGQALAEWQFLSDGRVFRNFHNKSSTQYSAGVQWVNTQQSPFGDYWIRATANADDLPDTGYALGTWWALTTTRYWGWEVTGSGFQHSSGSVKVEIATDSGGTNIVATGYYGGTADMEI